VLDNISLCILKHLQEDGRTTISELSQKIGLSPAATLERVRRLEDKKIITAYRALLDPLQLKLNLLVFIEVTLEKASPAVFEQFRQGVMQIPKVLECHMMAGGVDYLIKARCKDMTDYRVFLNDLLSQLPSIRETHTYTVMEELKSTTYLPIIPTSTKP
jgi:Lrp/AsnC family leucine-responsive transcriptional regulator